MKSDAKTSMIRVSEQTHRLLKGLAGLNGLTMSEMLEKMVSFWRSQNEETEECKLCRQYGYEPNDLTRQVIENADRGIGLSEPLSSEEFFKKFDKDYGNK